MGFRNMFRYSSRYAGAIYIYHKASIFFQIKDATGDVELSYTTENNYKGRLIIKDAVYTDTGYYYCVSNDTTECSLQMEGAQRKYIYVKGQSICYMYQKAFMFVSFMISIMHEEICPLMTIIIPFSIKIISNCLLVECHLFSIC